MEENRRQGRVFPIFLPIFVLYLIQSAASVFLTQIFTAITAAKKGPISAMALLKELLDISLSQGYVEIYTLFSSIVGVIVYGIWYIGILRRESRDSTEKRELSFEKPSYAMILVGIILITLGAQFVISFVTEIVIKLVPGWFMDYVSILDSVGLSAVGKSSVSIPIMLYVALFGPIFEELLFRGVCLKNALSCFGPKASVVLCAMLFAIFHGNPLQGIATFMFALLLGFVYERTRMIWVPILVHVLFNMISLFVPEMISLRGNPVVDFVIIFTSMVALYLGIKCVLRAGQTGAEN